MVGRVAVTTTLLSLTPPPAERNDRLRRIIATCRLAEYERDRAWMQAKLEESRAAYAAAKASGDEHLVKMRARGASDKTLKKAAAELQHDLADIVQEGYEWKMALERLDATRLRHMQTLGLAQERAA